MSRRWPRAGRWGTALSLLAVLVLFSSPPARAEQGLPAWAAGAPIGGVLPLGEAPVAVERLVLTVRVDSVPARIPLLPDRVTSTVEARYVLRLVDGKGGPVRLPLRFLGNQRVNVQFDGRPVEVYPAAYEPEADQGAQDEGDVAWVDPLTGQIYRAASPVQVAAPQALGVDVSMRPGAGHELRVHQERVTMGWDTGRYLNTVYHLDVPLRPDGWHSFGPVEVHLRLPPGFVAGVAGDDTGTGTGRLQGYGYHRWSAPPRQVRVAAMDTAGMWFGRVTQRRHVLWFLATAWILFVLLRALVWRLARRRDAWGWTGLPGLVALPAVVAWVSWESLQVPMWGYPFSLFQYAVLAAMGLYLAGRALVDVVSLLWLRWRYWREARAAGPAAIGRSDAGEGAGTDRPAGP